MREGGRREEGKERERERRERHTHTEIERGFYWAFPTTAIWAGVHWKRQK